MQVYNKNDPPEDVNSHVHIWVGHLEDEYDDDYRYDDPLEDGIVTYDTGWREYPNDQLSHGTIWSCRGEDEEPSDEMLALSEALTNDSYLMFEDMEHLVLFMRDNPGIWDLYDNPQKRILGWIHVKLEIPVGIKLTCAHADVKKDEFWKSHLNTTSQRRELSTLSQNKDFLFPRGELSCDRPHPSDRMRLFREGDEDVEFDTNDVLVWNGFKWELWDIRNLSPGDIWKDASADKPPQDLLDQSRFIKLSR